MVGVEALHCGSHDVMSLLAVSLCACGDGNNTEVEMRGSSLHMCSLVLHAQALSRVHPHTGLARGYCCRMCSPFTSSFRTPPPLLLLLPCSWCHTAGLGCGEHPVLRAVIVLRCPRQRCSW